VVVTHSRGGTVSVTPRRARGQPCARASACYRFRLREAFSLRARPSRGWSLAAWRPGCSGRARSCTRLVYDYPKIVAVFHRR
jgi:hypothetical protein